jgi:predicted DNA-binding transcriptional regulator YafY
MKTERKILNTSDIQRELGVSIRTAQRRMKELKTAYGKHSHQLITYTEFVKYYGLDL